MKILIISGMPLTLPPRSEIVQFQDGLSANGVYHFKTDEKQFVLRSVERSRFAHECRVLKHIKTAKIGPRLIQTDSKQHSFILSFIPGKLLPAFEEARLEDYLETGTQLRKLHGVPLLGEKKPHQPFKAIERTFHAIQEKGIPYPKEFERALASVREIQQALARAPSKFCHNDFHRKNVILSPEGPKVVDWSTAGDGDPYFDLAKLCIALPQSAKEQILLRYHRGNISEPERANFYLMEQALLLMISLNRFSRTEGGLLSSPLAANNFIDYPQSPEEFLSSALNALEAFLINSSTEEFKNSLKICHAHYR